MRRSLASTTHHARRTSACTAVAIAIALACGPFRRNSGTPPGVLYFTNESLDQAAVYAVGPNGHSVRIGTVLAGRTDTLVVPREVVSGGANVNVVARPLARSIAVQSGPVFIRPGEAVGIRLPVDEKRLIVVPVHP